MELLQSLSLQLVSSRACLAQPSVFSSYLWPLWHKQEVKESVLADPFILQSYLWCRQGVNNIGQKTVLPNWTDWERATDLIHLIPKSIKRDRKGACAHCFVFWYRIDYLGSTNHLNGNLIQVNINRIVEVLFKWRDQGKQALALLDYMCPKDSKQFYLRREQLGHIIIELLFTYFKGKSRCIFTITLEKMEREPIPSR